MTKKAQIVLTNDDGFDSPGIWAMAGALAELGELWVTAPSVQFSGAGRCYFRDCKGIIEERESKIPGKGIHAYAIDASPAQTIFHAVHEILPIKPDLVVSGINYGENLGNIVSSSGTIGAAIEAGSLGIKALAVSLQIPVEEGYLSYSERIDFSGAAWFSRLFAGKILENGLPTGVDMLKVDVPADANQNTPWKWTRVSRANYFSKVLKRKPEDGSLNIEWVPGFDWDMIEKDSDIYAVCKEKTVSVSPMTIDMTAKVTKEEMQTWDQE